MTDSKRILNRVADLWELKEIYKGADSRICELKKICERRKIPHYEYFTWMRRWEYAKAITETGVGAGDVVLDAGGHTQFLATN